MASIKSLMLGTAILAGAVGLGATNANAAQFGIYIGAPTAYVPPPVAYVPPSPGPGYAWTAGYYANGYWVPGRWAYAGHYDRDDFYRNRDWDRNRHYDRDDHRRDWDRDHDRFRR